jgi:hypothetical protein
VAFRNIHASLCARQARGARRFWQEMFIRDVPENASGAVLAQAFGAPLRSMTLLCMGVSFRCFIHASLLRST